MRGEGHNRPRYYIDSQDASQLCGAFKPDEASVKADCQRAPEMTGIAQESFPPVSGIAFTDQKKRLEKGKMAVCGLHDIDQRGAHKGDDGWRLTWIESRLRYIESAENMYYLIPGFRKTHNIFPKQIPFTASKDEVKEYRRKYFPKQKKINDDALAKKMGWGLNDDEEDAGEEDEFLNTPLLKVDEHEQQAVNGGDASANASSETLLESALGDGSGAKKGVEETSTSGIKAEEQATREPTILKDLRTQVTDLQKQLTSQNEQIAQQQ
ncbi:hypothetical protein BG015_003656 [Linnemannia schmuckeri]|uniref:Uncharacterized protein n=1 Tax=Linnemannia schmuckeri TaxID=64567 RepID=A0A9P5VD62_9FUNG|nr:hypothetical protein BG015_003656 [Linnemannia schmuckeri]